MFQGLEFEVFGYGVWGAAAFDHGQLVTYFRVNDIKKLGIRYRAIWITTRQSRPNMALACRNGSLLAR